MILKKNIIVNSKQIIGSCPLLTKIICILGWMVTRKAGVYWDKSGPVKDIIMFIAQNSLWVYLWHIFFLKIIGKFPVENFVLKYVLVYTGAVLFTFFQTFSVKKWLLPSIQNEHVRKDLKAVLTG